MLCIFKDQPLRSALYMDFGRVIYVTLARAPVSPGFLPSLTSVIKAHERNPAILGFNTSHSATQVWHLLIKHSLNTILLGYLYETQMFIKGFLTNLYTTLQLQFETLGNLLIFLMTQYKMIQRSIET